MHDENIHEPNINVSTVSNPSSNPPKPDRSQESKYKKQKLNGKQSDIPSLEFESRFECGNLHRVIQVGPTEYDLLVSSDCNSQRHRQWFYFRVQKYATKTLHINLILLIMINLIQFIIEVKPCIYSQKDSNKQVLDGQELILLILIIIVMHSRMIILQNSPNYNHNKFLLQCYKKSLLSQIYTLPLNQNQTKIIKMIRFRNENATKSGQSSDIDEIEATLIMSNINSNLSPPKVSKRRKSASETSSLKSSAKKSKRYRKKSMHDNCYSESLADSRNHSLSPQPPKIKISRRKKSSKSPVAELISRSENTEHTDTGVAGSRSGSTSTSASASLAPSISNSVSSSRDPSPKPMSRLKYKQLRKEEED